MQQRQQPRDTGGGGQGLQRSVMNLYATQSGTTYQPQPQQQQQQTSSFLQYPMAMEPAAARTYSQQQQGNYWQASDTSTSTSGYDARQERRHGGSLDLGEFDMMDTNATRDRNDGTAGGAPSEAASEMGFDVNSFHDGLAGTSGVSEGDSGASHKTVPEPTTFTTKAKKSTTPASADPAMVALVDAAYTQFNESTDAPDLATELLTKDRNERCQFPECPNRARVSQSYGTFCNRHVIVAPCGFPGCREKAMERAAMCTKHMELGKKPLQEILDARTQNVPVCKMSGCFKNDQGRGYCRGHEKLLMATGRLPPHINKRRLNSAYTMCSYPECTKHSQRNHLCRTHGNLIIKQAKELADRPAATESYDEILERMQKDIRRCTHENCTKNSQRDRLCTMHYYELHNLQKDGSAPSSGKASKDQTGPRQRETEASGGSDVRPVEQIRCGKPGCGNLSYAAGLCVEHTKENQNHSQSQGRLVNSFSSGESERLFPDDVGNEAKPGLFFVSEKPQVTRVPISAGVGTMTNTTHTKCTNPMCDRESYGRDYCEACQRLFSPLVVAINPLPASSQEHPLNPAGSGMAQPEEKALLCRVSNCDQDCVRGGLCATHLRAFKTGALSVDNLKLDSQAQQQQREQELAEAAAVAAAAAESKQSSPLSSKSKRYYCKVEGCDKQAQKRNLCKRHYRLQEDVQSQPEVTMSGPTSNYVPAVQQIGFSQPTIACRFPSCSQIAGSGSLLCLAHSKATFCWQPGCENLVDCHQFCEFHAFRQQCAYEGCMYSAERNSSGCASHAMARRCRHEFCDKFAVGNDWCRLHQISCQDSPCALCRLHSLSSVRFAPSENENSNRSRYNANLNATSVLSHGSYSSGNAFGRNPRLM